MTMDNEESLPLVLRDFVVTAFFLLTLAFFDIGLSDSAKMNYSHRDVKQAKSWVHTFIGLGVRFLCG